MDIIKEKISLINQIALLEDEELIDAIKHIVSFGLKKQGKSKTDFWDNLTEIQKNRIEDSIASLDKSTRIAHRDVMDEFKKKFQK